jgi:deoxyribodipyrimidine photolyase-related protein
MTQSCAPAKPHVPLQRCTGIFLDRHKETFAKNHRMSQQIFGLNRLSDLPELKERAQEVLEGLQKGKI